MILITPNLRHRLKRIPLARPLVRAIRWCLDPHVRSIWRLERQPHSGLFQPSPMTKPDRYPRFFAFVQHQLAHTARPKILSYGCSTGEEVFTLHTYFPHADITGIDINPHNIKRCNRQWRKMGAPAALRFICAGTPAGESSAAYDAIFCMAVLRHGGLMNNPPERCTPLIAFTRYEALVTDLARCLKEGGYLAFWNSHFRFADTAIAPHFEVALSDPSGKNANTPLYGRDNLRLDVEPYNEAVFCKRPGAR